MDSDCEWLEADGLGGFASGSVGGIRTRRYHALLLAATTPPTGRFVLVNGFEAWVETPAGRFALSSQRYAPGIVHPDGLRRVVAFTPHPWPQWTFALEDGTRLVHELLAQRGMPLVALSWKVEGKAAGMTLSLRPLLSGRDYHGLQRENPAFGFEPQADGAALTWQPYPGVPAIVSVANAEYRHQPDWYRNFVYEQEQQRGLDCQEDLASPGVLRWDLSRGEAVWVLAAETESVHGMKEHIGADAPAFVRSLRSRERRRRTQNSPLYQAAAAYIVRRGEGQTLVAGYPWFTDWGRDTFIALRGLCLASGRFQEAKRILIDWARLVSQGMLPNRFPDHGPAPEFNAVDASLWFIIAVHDLLTTMQAEGKRLTARDRAVLEKAVLEIVEGYAGGTRYRIHADVDGLLAAGEPGVQLTWMDAKVGDWVVTPRIGKPVEVQALWLNALCIAAASAPKWSELYERGLASFRTRFWNPAQQALYDVVDVNHENGSVDASFRPNQIFAVGGLPFSLLEDTQARMVVDAVERRLLTPLGLRSLAPGEPGYVPRYQGGVRERDGAYHQGCVWPWLMGAFVEAWVRVRGNTAAAKKEARQRFLTPLLDHLQQAGLGHISEIADAEPPHTPRDCPFQAWSLAEAIRLDSRVLA